MRLDLAIQGRLAAHMEAEEAALEHGVTAAAKKISPRLERAVRAQIARAHGPVTAKAWTGRVYPTSGVSADAVVFQRDRSSDEWVVRSVTEPGRIKSPSGNWLAIPTEAALLALPRSLHHGRERKTRRSPIAVIEQKFGNLQYVYPRGRGRGRYALLVATVRRGVRRLRGGGTADRISRARRTKSGIFGSGAQSVVMFVLVPSVARAGQVNLAALAQSFASQYAAEIERQWAREAAERGVA